MIFPFADVNKIVIDRLQKYESLDIQLQSVTGLKLETFLEIAKTFPLLIDDKNKTSIYKIAGVMRKTGLSFQDLNKLFVQKYNSFYQLLPWYSRLWIKIKSLLKIK